MSQRRTSPRWYSRTLTGCSSMFEAYQARVRVTRAGKGMHLGCFGTAEEAALAVARVTDARTPAPAAAPRVAAAKRTAPPPPKPPAPANKQPRNTLPKTKSRETNIRERLRDTTELGFHIGPSEK